MAKTKQEMTQEIWESSPWMTWSEAEQEAQRFCYEPNEVAAWYRETSADAREEFHSRRMW